MASRPPLRLWLTAAVLAAAPAARGQSAPDPAAVEFFESRVRPILVDNCTTCHSAATNAKGGLRVDDRNGLLAGGNSGPAVVPGKPDESLLIQAVEYEDAGLKMPPKKRLTPEQVADLTKWIADGAAWPAERVTVAVGKPNETYERLRKEHWAWQPLARAAPPEVSDPSWARADLDRYILAKLEARGLKPAPDADRPDLIRRVTFDLTGLPPSPEEVDAFVRDDAPDAFEKVVDRLLASPAFGERWGRHWLDVARYGESTGSSRNLPLPHAWRYRDYVIDSFAKDKPYDQFLREQVAGDLLPADSQAERDEHTVATGFLALGVKDVNQRFKVRYVMDNVDEQIDTVTRAILATTASCARCHDHKFDPIPTADYYALAGIFRSSDLCAGLRNKMGGGGLDYYDPSLLIPVGTAKADAPSPEKVEKAKEAYEAAKKEFEAIRGTPEGLAPGPNGQPKQRPLRQKMVRLQNEYQKLVDPAQSGPVAFGVRDAKQVADTEIRIRGEAERLGPVVPRGFLSLLDVPDAPGVNPAQSGRLELARWLTSEANPLTPRVMVNRVWGHLFGRGIVKTVDNFGTTGDVPSHPELLDHLAGEFVRDGWSVKKLVRKIVLSRAYGLGSGAIPENVGVDPANSLVWRHAPRRLTAEEIRDATLLAAGALDARRPVASPAKDLAVMELPNNGPVARKIVEEGRKSRHRSVYLPLLRGLTPTALEVFDFAEQGMVTGHRDTTTVAPQALYLLNDPFVRRNALDLAVRVLSRTELDETARLDLAYRLTLGRGPNEEEIGRASAFLAEFESEAVEVFAEEDAAAASEAEVRRFPNGLAAFQGPGPRSDAAVASNDTGTAKAPPVPVNPDEVIPEDAPVKEEVIRAANPREAAWAGLCQALLGSAEFRFVR